MIVIVIESIQHGMEALAKHANFAKNEDEWCADKSLYSSVLCGN